MSINNVSGDTESLSRKNKGLLALVIVLGILIIVATTILVFTIIHRITHKNVENVSVQMNSSSITRPVSVLSEPSGTRISTITRQSDQVLVIGLTGGGPDRLVFWDLERQQKMAEVKLSISDRNRTP